VAKYSSTYRLEGIAYYVSNTPAPGALTVHRFYNFRVGGVHFYTASETEKNDVMNKYSSTFRYEGPGYYVGQ